MKKCLSSSQLIILLFLCRHYSLLTYTSNAQNLEASLSAIFIADIINLIFLIPTFLIFRRNKSNNLMLISKNTSPLLTKVITLTLFIFFLLTSFISLTDFEKFITTTIFTSASSAIIIFSMLVLCTYAASTKLNTLGKVASLLLPIILLGIALIVFCALFNIDFDNFRPILENPVLTIFNRGLLLAVHNVELVPLIYLLPFLTEGQSEKKVLTGFLISYTIAHEILIFTSIAVLGEYTYIQYYPSYAIATVAKFSIFQRLDSLYMLIWVLMGFIRISLNLFLAINVLNYIIPSKYNKWLLGLISIIFLIVGVYRNHILGIKLATSIFITHHILAIICLVIFPLLLLIIQLFQKRESYS